jgi:hypothetical protein
MSAPIVSDVSSRPSISQEKLIPRSRGQDQNELPTRIERQRIKVRALELAAQERRRADQLRVQEQDQGAESWRHESRQSIINAASIGDRGLFSRQQEQQRHMDRQAWEEAGTHDLLRHKANVAHDAEDRRQQKGAHFNQQEEQRCDEKLARGESAILQYYLEFFGNDT